MGVKETIYVPLGADGGMVNDPRDTKANAVRVLSNFDALSNRKRLTPYRDSESGDSGAATSKKQAFGIGLWTPGPDYRLFGLGVQSGLSLAEVNMKKLETTGAGNGDLADSTWLAPAHNQSASGAASFDLFVYYKTTGKFYGAKGGNKIWAFTPNGSTNWDDDIISTNGGSPPSYTHIAQGLVHSKDDILYIPYDNKIMKNDSASWTIPAITLPSRLYITSISEYGNFISIVCAPLSGVGGSVNYLWDRQATLTTLSETIDLGEGNVMIAEQIEGILVTISISNDLTRFQSRITFREYSTSQGAIEFASLISDSNASILLKAKQKANNRLYFILSVTLNGSVREGVFSIGRNRAGQFCIFHEHTPNNDTAISNGTLNGFIVIGDFVFISYQSGGSFALSKTKSTAAYTATAILETVINPGMPDEYKQLTKKLVSVGATYAPLPANGAVAVKQRINGGSFATVFTESTDGVVRTQPVIPFVNGAAPSDGEEIEFRMESTGGAEITGLIYTFETLSSN